MGSLAVVRLWEDSGVLCDGEGDGRRGGEAVGVYGGESVPFMVASARGLRDGCLMLWIKWDISRIPLSRA